VQKRYKKNIEITKRNDKHVAV